MLQYYPYDTPSAFTPRPCVSICATRCGSLPRWQMAPRIQAIRKNAEEDAILTKAGPGASWYRNAREVFRYLDYPLWRLTEHNPVSLLSMLSPERYLAVARDPTFLALYDAAIKDLGQARTAKDTWWNKHFPDLSMRPVVYFSAEFALHQSLPIYAGGLGVLAGDVCKEASDLGLPLVGIGFMYPQGYFHQRVSAEGRQEE